MERVTCVLHGDDAPPRTVAVILSPGSLLNVHCIKAAVGPGSGAVHICDPDGTNAALLPIDERGDSRVPFPAGARVDLWVSGLGATAKPAAPAAAASASASAAAATAADTDALSAGTKRALSMPSPAGSAAEQDGRSMRARTYV
jgi:hypothetical protein